MKTEQAERHRIPRLRIEQDERQRELRPVRREIEDGGGAKTWRDERQRDRPQRAEARRAIEPRGFEERGGTASKKFFEHPRGERHLDRGVGENQTAVRVDQPQPLDDAVERQQQHDRRQHLHCEQRAEQRPAPWKRSRERT